MSAREYNDTCIFGCGNKFEDDAEALEHYEDHDLLEYAE